MTSRTRIASLATAMALLASTAETTTVSWPFTGCEAAEIAALAATDPTGWSGDAHRFGPLTLSHAARLDCGEGACRALLTMVTERDGRQLAAEPVAAPLTLTTRGRHQGQRLSLVGAPAISLRDDLGRAAFMADGLVKRVAMDYGTLAGAVSVRIRTEVACSLEAEHCTIEADPIAYIPDDDRNTCGAFAATN